MNSSPENSLYINLQGILILRLRSLPKAFIAARAFLPWKQILKIILNKEFSLKRLADDSPVHFRTKHALRRVLPCYEELEVIWLNNGKRSTRKFLASYENKLRLSTLCGIPSVGELMRAAPKISYREEFIIGRQLRIQDLRDTKIRNEISTCFIKMAEFNNDDYIAHGDPHMNNFIVRKRDKKVFLVDFDSAMRAPFLFDMLYFCVYVIFEKEFTQKSHSEDREIFLLFQQLLNAFKNSKLYSDKITPNEVIAQWKILSQHFNSMWGEHENNQLLQNIIKKWSEKLTTFYFECS